ncbi:transposable element Tcb2 transposase [Trichonephila clavipes]|nr:transposable element Tcb2 transposase [Trichonephila clavipes]
MNCRLIVNSYDKSLPRIKGCEKRVIDIDDIPNIQQNVTSLLNSIPKEDFLQSFQDMYSLSQRCIVMGGVTILKNSKVTLVNISPTLMLQDYSPNFIARGFMSKQFPKIRRHGGGRVRSTTPTEDRYIVLSAKRNRRTTAQQVANQFLAASGKQISRKTVARRLRGGGLYARRPVVCVPLTRQHRTARLQWCREHHNWTEQDWACVLFSDESRFSLSSDCRRQLIWRESGTAYRPENIQEKDRYPTFSIMVWAGIMINGRTRLHVVANGTMTGQRYIDEVLLPHVRLFRSAVGDKFVFMDDNATCNRTLAVQDCLDSEGIQRLVWPARSSDLNPIEKCGMLWGGKLLVETILRQTRTPSSVHSQRNGINCLNSCWIMLCKVWYDVWNVASHSTVDISRTDTFL